MTRRSQHRAERQRAHRLSDLVDSMVVQRRWCEETATTAPTDGELTELATLAAELNAIVLAPEPGTRARLFTRLRDMPAHRRRMSEARLALFRSLAIGLSPVSALAIVAAIVLVLLNLRGPLVAASEILSKSDQAIVKLLRPGKVLFRRWRIVEKIWDAPGLPPRVVERYTLEWIDGSDVRHATGKSISSSGRMFLAYANVLDGGQYVPRVYYDPGYGNEPNGLLSIVPSRHEFEAAAARFAGRDREIVDSYLARGPIYEPILSERRFNHAMFRGAAAPEMLPHVVLSVDESAMLHGVDVYRVRSIEAVRVPFRWRSVGPPNMWLERRETLSYVAKDSFLTLRSEETVQTETGRRVEAVRELVDTQSLNMPSGPSDPFALTGAERVQTRRQSAAELFSQLTRTLVRAPAFLERHRAALTEER